MLLPLIYLGILLILAGGVYLLWSRIGKQKSITNAESLVVLKVLLPKDTQKSEEADEEAAPKKDFRETMSVAEQFLASFSSLYEFNFTNLIWGQRSISFEFVAKDGLISFYVAVPRDLQSTVERQLHSIYPFAQIEPSNDWRMFPAKAYLSGMDLRAGKTYEYPIKTYQKLESDPLNALTNAFSKLPEGVTAGFQVIIRPTSGRWTSRPVAAAQKIAEGSTQQGGVSAVIGQGEKDNKNQSYRLSAVQEERMKSMQQKASKVGFETQLRVVVSSQRSKDESSTALQAIAAAFAQYNSPEGNSLYKIEATDLKQFGINYVLRRFVPRFPLTLSGTRLLRRMILNTEELASLYHFPNRFLETPNIDWLSARTLPPPSNLPAKDEGTVQLGKSVFRGEERPINIKLDDRRRHIYAIGKTGVGKTTLFTYQIEQDIKAGRGVCYIDPNGDAVEQILGLVPKERAEDVILFDPSDTERPVGINMLEWKRPEDRDFLVAEWLEIFYKLFDPNRTGMVGPQFEHWGRNASLSVMARPEGGTLIDIPRLFTDDAFREETVKHVTDPVVLAFWNQQLAKTADFHKSEMYNYFISKFGRFMTNDLIRNLIGQTKSGFDFREIMDSGKIFLVNLSKGKIGETNSHLLGMILVSKLQVAAFQRADTPEEERKDFYLYVDEFQNFTTDTFKTILAEARKYRLNLNITNQYIAQLPEDIRDAVIGNAGTLVSFRIGAADAEFMEKEFPKITELDLVNLPFANTYIKLLIDGTPTRPFSMRTIKSETKYHKELAEAIRQLSRLKYGRDRLQVEQELANRQGQATDSPPDLPPTREGGQ